LAAGGLQPLLDRDEVEDITANGADVVLVRVAGGGWEPAAPIADSDEELVELVRLLAARNDTGEERRFDRASPTLNLQLPDGSRLNAVMSVSKRPAVAIRRHRYRTMTMPELVALGTLDASSAELLSAAVRARMNLIVAGKTGAGKTTFLRGLASVIPTLERIITLEDTYELGLELFPASHSNVVAMQAREPNLEGEGGVSLAALFRNGLRMLPDRVFVGEVRGDEVVPMLNAMSQGNDGSMSTIHASSSAGVFRKLGLYAAQAPERLDMTITNMHIAEGVDLVAHLGEVNGRRVLTSVREVVDADGDQVTSNEILRPHAYGPAVPGAPPSHDLLSRLVEHGFDPDLLHRPHTQRGWDV
jgi:Flp pilus assembly CpaF family ATPase